MDVSPIEFSRKKADVPQKKVDAVMKHVASASWTGFGKGSVWTGISVIGSLHYQVEGNRVMACVNASLLNELFKAHQKVNADNDTKESDTDPTLLGDLLAFFHSLSPEVVDNLQKTLPDQAVPCFATLQYGLLFENYLHICLFDAFSMVQSTKYKVQSQLQLTVSTISNSTVQYNDKDFNKHYIDINMSV